MKLAGKVAIVTGSSSGIGKETARTLATHGAAVVVNSRASTGLGIEVAESLPEAIFVQADVSRDDEAARLVHKAVQHWGRLDILVNNAGTTEFIPHDDLDAVTDETWNKIIGVNVLGAWHTTRAAVSQMRRNDGGSVVNVSSLAGINASGSSIPYAVSKAALNHLTRLLAKTLAPDIRVNAVAPGIVEGTAWTTDWMDTALDKWEADNPLRRAAQPADVVFSIIHLMTSDYLTGQIVVVDGGHSLL
jgi:ketoreductase RED2